MGQGENREEQDRPPPVADEGRAKFAEYEMKATERRRGKLESINEARKSAKHATLVPLPNKNHTKVWFFFIVIYEKYVKLIL